MEMFQIFDIATQYKYWNISNTSIIIIPLPDRRARGSCPPHAHAHAYAHAHAHVLQGSHDGAGADPAVPDRRARGSCSCSSDSRFT